MINSRPSWVNTSGWRGKAWSPPVQDLHSLVDLMARDHGTGLLQVIFRGLRQNHNQRSCCNRTLNDSARGGHCF